MDLIDNPGDTMRLIAITAIACSLAACTSINVRPVDDIATLREVCIVRNPKVTVSDFISVLQDGFNRHGVPTRVVEPNLPNNCDATLTYTALRSWDMALYISHAELRLWRAGRQIGAADYHLKGKGGFALTKWGSTQKKMDPVIDQLLGGASTDGPPPTSYGGRAPAPPPSTDAPPPSQENCEACKRIGKP